MVRGGSADDHEGSRKAFLCMAVIGTGYLFPISAIWAAFDYWKQLFPGTNIEFTVTVIYQLGSVLTVAVLSMSKQFVLRPRILKGMTGQFLCLAAIFGFRWLHVPNATLYNILIGLTLLVAIATGVLDSALLALCSQYSPQMQGWLQLGIGLGTLVSVIYRDLTKLFLAGDIVNATSAYFGVALATILICVWAFKVLMALPVSAALVRSEERTARRLALENAQGELAQAMRTETSFSEEQEPGMRPVMSPSMLSPAAGMLMTPGGTKRTASEVEEGSQRMTVGTGFLDVWPYVWKNQLAIFLNLFLTTLCYPGMITSIPCRQMLHLREGQWFQTLLLTAFTLADICARFCTNHRLCLRPGNVMWTVAVRVCVFPLVLLCAAWGDAQDTWAFVAVGAFGFLNGYCVSLSLILVNEVPRLTAEQLKTNGRISACSVNGGLCAGSLGAMLLATTLSLGAD